MLQNKKFYIRRQTSGASRQSSVVSNAANETDIQDVKEMGMRKITLPVTI